MAKNFILNAKGAGSDKACNAVIQEGISFGLLKSISLSPTGEFFEDVVKNILPNCEGLGVGIELDLTSGRFLCTDLETIKNNETYFSLFLKALNPNNKSFLADVEREFRLQIEKLYSKNKISHIDSKDYIHSIPPIFDMVCRLAKEYQIKQVCTHFESFYIVPDVFRHLNKNYVKNFSKKMLLNFLTLFNENTIHHYELETNDYLIGTSYADSMDSMSIAYALKTLKGKNLTVEADISPRRYEDGTIDKHFDEYVLIKNKRLKSKIEKLGYNITNYVKDEPEKV